MESKSNDEDELSNDNIPFAEFNYDTDPWFEEMGWA